MKYQVNGDRTSQKAIPEDILQTAAELHDGLVEFSDIYRDTSELWECYDNCMHALECIQHDPKSLDILDLDKSLSAALAVETLTTDKAVAGLESMLGDFWEKIKALFSKIWNWIKSFFVKADDKTEKINEKTAELKKVVGEVDKSELDKLLDEKMDRILTVECVRKLQAIKSISDPGDECINVLDSMLKIANKLVSISDDKLLEGTQQGDGQLAAASVSMSEALTKLKTNRAKFNVSLNVVGLEITDTDPAHIVKVASAPEIFQYADTMRAGGWTNAKTYVDETAILANAAAAAFREIVGRKAQWKVLEAQCDTCIAKCESKAKKIKVPAVSRVFKEIARDLFDAVEGIGLLTLAITKVNVACYNDALDRKVYKLAGKDRQPLELIQ